MTRRRAFTIGELLIVVAVLALLAAIVLPFCAHVRGKWQGLNCMRDRKQLGLAWAIYAQDYDEHAVPLAVATPAPNGALLPGGQTWWPDLLWPYARAQSLYVCPSRASWGIGMNRPEVGRWLKGGPALAHIAHPEATVIFADAAQVTNPGEKDPDRWIEHRTQGHVYFRTPNDLPGFNADPQRVVNRHDGKAIVVFADGGVVFRNAGQLGFQYPKGHALALWDLK
jgi:prepilin-type processing-associated H-X9-DG protein